MGACGWPLSFASCRDTTALDGMSDDERAMVEQMAIDLLWNWTGRVYGACEVEYRPCRQNCGQDGYAASGWTAASGGSPWTPVLLGGKWHNVSCGKCGDNCGCGSAVALKLPWPVASIDEVLIDGVVLDPSRYRLDSRSILQRTDGGEWPTCQNLNLASTEPNTWKVTYQWGLEVPAGGQIAAGLLAVEMAMAICNDSKCQLPQRIQSITRQGVTMTLLDRFEDVSVGRTGIWLVDAWLASVRFAPRGGTVHSVDVPKKRYQIPTP